MPLLRRNPELYSWKVKLLDWSRILNIWHCGRKKIAKKQTLSTAVECLVMYCLRSDNCVRELGMVSRKKSCCSFGFCPNWLSFFAVSEYAPPQISCLIEWLMAFFTPVHLASSVGERMSLHFYFVLLKSGTFNTVAFDKLEPLYFKDFLIFWKTFNL